MSIKQNQLLLAVIFALVQGVCGQTWMPSGAPSNYWQSVASSADGKILAAAGHSGAGGVVFISTNSGNNWTPANLPTNIFYSGIALSADGSRMATIYNGGGMYYSSDYGSNWALNSTPFPQIFGLLPHVIASSADGMKLAVSCKMIYMSSDGGVTWTSNNISGPRYASIACSADGEKLAVNSLDASLIYLSTNEGLTWVTNTVTNGAFQDIACSADGTHLIAAGSLQISSFIYTSSNSGTTWISNNAAKAFWGPVASSADGVYLAAATGAVSISTNGTWTTNTPKSSSEFASLAFSADGGQLVVATGGEGLGGIYTLRVTRSPALSAAVVNTNLILSWLAPSTNYILQQSPDLVAWASATNPVSFNLTNLNDQVTVSPSNSSGFYRLALPQ